ncbi:MAG: hypothetical protein H0V01_08790 [Bacteroidetes bacterium]|nr:hypothetical protein [Bacteroidota bacterium]HET6244586.1 MauE/DoxX family redox-associated membrane protein [Bacteroidia bacterium]
MNKKLYALKLKLADFDQEKRVGAIKFILLAALFIGIMLSYNLWLTESIYFPLTPLFDFFPGLIQPFDHILLYIIILLIAVGFVYPFNFLLNISLFILLLILAFLDINRFQPWVYQYLLMLLAFSSMTKKQGPAFLIPALQLLLCGIFFWSGIFKFNHLYFSQVVNRFSESMGNNVIVYGIGLLIPVLELFTAIGLLVRKSRKIAIFTAFFIHFFYLLVTGPLGSNTNTVLWPWNTAMPLFVFFLFTGEHLYFSQNLKGFFQLNITRAILLLAWIIPIFNLFNLWPAYTSFNLYSGNTNNGSIYISDQTKSMLPEKIGKLVKNNALEIKEWSMEEMNVPAFPEKKVFLSARNFIYNYAADSTEVVLYYRPKTHLIGNPQAEFY